MNNNNNNQPSGNGTSRRLNIPQRSSESNSKYIFFLDNSPHSQHIRQLLSVLPLANTVRIVDTTINPVSDLKKIPCYVHSVFRDLQKDYDECMEFVNWRAESLYQCNEINHDTYNFIRKNYQAHLQKKNPDAYTNPNSGGSPFGSVRTFASKVLQRDVAMKGDYTAQFGGLGTEVGGAVSNGRNSLEERQSFINAPNRLVNYFDKKYLEEVSSRLDPRRMRQESYQNSLSSQYQSSSLGPIPQYFDTQNRRVGARWAFLTQNNKLL